VTQFHFDAGSYLDVIRAEVPKYDELQEEVARLVRGPIDFVLDLGAGTGSTSAAVLRRFPEARVILLDESPQMLAIASSSFRPERIADTIVGDLLDALPDGRFDAVVSALAIHHLDAQRKRQLFARLRDVVKSDGCFVIADVVVPDDPHDAVTALSPDVDHPDRVTDLLAWLREAGFDASCPWKWKDLAIVAAV
jgi:tRNA (cmo5U34)-methyltransferase